ncbi:hypothetical protein LJB85_00460 [Porphyromonadaceae bacterium OttesenSCG-928-L07]|nr:hypothetical protein [Porphyromonadaceae bacterium OttesenSCG-928-L07]
MQKKFLILFLTFLWAINLFAEEKKAITRYEDLDEKSRVEFDYSFLEGIGNKISGNMSVAMGWFDNCLKIYPGSSAVKYEIANILLVGEDYNGALYMAREAVAGNPGNLWYKLFLANVLQKKAMIEEAGKVYAEIISKYPEKEEYYLLEANLYISIEKWQKAIEVLNRYEKTFGVNELISFEKIKLYTKLDDTKQISAELTKLITKYPERSEYLSLLADLYFTYDQDKKGLKILNDLLKKDPDNGYVHLFLADYYMSRKKYQEADKHTQKAFLSHELDNSYKIQYVLNLMVNYDSTQVSESTIDGYVDILIKNYSDDLSVRILYSDFLRKDGKVNEAREQLEFVLSKDKDNYIVWEDLLLICNELVDTSCMYEKSVEMIQYFPDRFLPYAMAGIASVLRDQYTNAVDFFNDGLQLADENMYMKAQFYSYLGDCYYQLDSVEKAFEMYDHVLKITPDDLGVLNNYAYYLSLREEQLDKAEDMSSKTVLEEPDNATFLDTYAWVLFKRKDYSQALYYIKKAFEKEEDPSGVLYEHYGDILFMNNRKEEALEMWKKAKELGGEEVSSELEIKIEKEALEIKNEK